MIDEIKPYIKPITLLAAGAFIKWIADIVIEKSKRKHDIKQKEEERLRNAKAFEKKYQADRLLEVQEAFEELVQISIKIKLDSTRLSNEKTAENLNVAVENQMRLAAILNKILKISSRINDASLRGALGRSIADLAINEASTKQPNDVLPESVFQFYEISGNLIKNANIP